MKRRVKAGEQEVTGTIDSPIRRLAGELREVEIELEQ